MKHTSKWIFVMVLVWAATVWAGRPLTIDDAEPVEFGKFQLQAGFSYIDSEGESSYNIPLGLSYGIVKNLEVGVGTGWQWNQQSFVEENCETTRHESGIDNLALGFKWKLLDQEKFFFDQTLTGGVLFPTTNRDRGLCSGRNDYDLTWIATRQITEQLALDANIGYTWVGVPNDEDNADVVHYGIAARYQLTKVLQPVGEIFFNTPADGHGKTDGAVNAGLRWSISDSLVIDAAVGAGFTGEAPHVFATTGLTWVF